MNEPKKRYPADREKLHALLEKKEQALVDLTNEVQELRERTLAADRTAIITNCEMYSLTPEMLAEHAAGQAYAPPAAFARRNVLEMARFGLKNPIRLINEMEA